MINLSDTACSKLTDIIESNAQFKGKALRLYVQGGGCSGLSYGFDFTDDQLEGDEEYVFGVVKVWVDDRSFGYLKGATIDYQETPSGGGFQIKNPNGNGSCGCGSAGSGQH